MKSLLLVSVLFILAHSVSAQFSKGDKILGGSATFSSGKSKNDWPNPPFSRDPENKSMSVSFNPSLGFFTSASTVHGFRLNLALSESRQKSSDASQPETKSGAFGIGGGYFFRKYKTFAGNLGGFAELGAGYMYSKPRHSSGSVATHTISADAKIGLYYAINNRLLIEGALGLVGGRYDFYNADVAKYRAWTFNGGLSTGFSLGVQFLFHK